MCTGFGIIVTKDGRYLFCEPDSSGDVSHSEILRRAGIKENEDKFNRAFVRVEITTWKIDSFRFDEDSTIPGWVDADEVKTHCKKLLKRIAPAYAEYEKVRAPAQSEYEKVRTQAYAEYERVRTQAYAEYEKVRAPAYAEYEKVRAQAYAEYEKVLAQAQSEYERVRTQAYAEYEKVLAPAYAEFIAKISSIDGYVRANGRVR